MSRPASGCGTPRSTTRGSSPPRLQTSWAGRPTSGRGATPKCGTSPRSTTPSTSSGPAAWPSRIGSSPRVTRSPRSSSPDTGMSACRTCAWPPRRWTSSSRTSRSRVVPCTLVPERDRRATRSARPVFVLVVVEQVAQGPARHVLELLDRKLQRGDALGAEVAEVLAQLAVAGHRPALAPEEEAQRPDGARAGRAALVDVLEADLPPFAKRRAQPPQLGGDRAGNAHSRGEQRSLGE